MQKLVFFLELTILLQAMRKRLLIKNFVTQMLDQEKQMNITREQLVSQCPH